MIHNTRCPVKTFLNKNVLEILGCPEKPEAATELSEKCTRAESVCSGEGDAITRRGRTKSEARPSFFCPALHQPCPCGYENTRVSPGILRQKVASTYLGPARARTRAHATPTK